MKRISFYLFLMFGLLLTGCKFENQDFPKKEPYNLNYNQYQYYSSIFNHQLYEGVSLVDEMDQFANKYQGGIVDTEYNNEDFFDSNSLIAFLLPESSGGNRNKITSYSLKDGKLTIDIERTVLGDSADMAYWLVLFELSNKEYEKINNVFINRYGIFYELENIETFETKMPKEMPDDFWIFITVTPFVNYDSRSKILRDGYDKSSRPNTAELVLEEKKLKDIYKLLRDNKFDMYPEAAFVSEEGGLGGYIYLSMGGNGVDKSITFFETRDKNVEDWICCKEIGNMFYKIFDEYIKDSDAFKNLQQTKRSN